MSKRLHFLPRAGKSVSVWGFFLFFFKDLCKAYFVFLLQLKFVLKLNLFYSFHLQNALFPTPLV